MSLRFSGIKELAYDPGLPQGLLSANSYEANRNIISEVICAGPGNVESDHGPVEANSVVCFLKLDDLKCLQQTRELGSGYRRRGCGGMIDD